MRKISEEINAWRTESMSETSKNVPEIFPPNSNIPSESGKSKSDFPKLCLEDDEICDPNREGTEKDSKSDEVDVVRDGENVECEEVGRECEGEDDECGKVDVEREEMGPERGKVDVVCDGEDVERDGAGREGNDDDSERDESGNAFCSEGKEETFFLGFINCDTTLIKKIISNGKYSFKLSMVFS
jgi:hypothetical protein